MALQCGIVGLPNVGKSTLFNCLSNAKAQAANFPFCTIEPNVGVITVPDERLTKLADGTRQEVGFKLGEQHQNVTYYQDYTIMRYADVLLMHSELNGNADGLNQVHQRVYPGETLAYSIENIRKEIGRAHV